MSDPSTPPVSNIAGIPRKTAARVYRPVLDPEAFAPHRSAHGDADGAHRLRHDGARRGECTAAAQWQQQAAGEGPGAGTGARRGCMCAQERTVYRPVGGRGRWLPQRRAAGDWACPHRRRGGHAAAAGAGPAGRRADGGVRGRAHEVNILEVCSHNYRTHNKCWGEEAFWLLGWIRAPTEDPDGSPLSSATRLPISRF